MDHLWPVVITSVLRVVDTRDCIGYNLSMTQDELAKIFAPLPDLHRQMLLEACEHFYYIAREEYADGSGDSSPQQDAVSELSDALRTPDQQTEMDATLGALQDGIASMMHNVAPDVKGIRFGTGDEGFDWDDKGNVKR